MATERPSDGGDSQALEARLAEIQRLWNQLQHAQCGSPDYRELQAAIRRESQAYLAAGGDDR